jgi:hypothetical protein
MCLDREKPPRHAHPAALLLCPRPRENAPAASAPANPPQRCLPRMNFLKKRGGLTFQVCMCMCVCECVCVRARCVFFNGGHLPPSSSRTMSFGSLETRNLALKSGRGVWMLPCMYVCVCIYVCIYTYVHTCYVLHTYVCVYTYTYTHTHIYINTHTHTHTHTHVDLALQLLWLDLQSELLARTRAWRHAAPVCALPSLVRSLPRQALPNTHIHSRRHTDRQTNRQTGQTDRTDNTHTFIDMCVSAHTHMYVCNIRIRMIIRFIIVFTFIKKHFIIFWMVFNYFIIIFVTSLSAFFPYCF